MSRIKQESEYDTFGEEWAKEINKIPKVMIIKMLADKGKENETLKECESLQLEKSKKLVEAAKDLAKIAEVMNELKSSHCYFILQEAFGDAIEWGDCQRKLDSIKQALADFKEETNT